MTIELTNLEKATVVDQHIKNLSYTIYNLTLSLREAQAVAIPSQEGINSLNLQISDTTAQMAILQAELASLQTESSPA
jgi:hypothetical protein